MRIIKEFPWCQEYGITEVTVDICLYNPDYITIWNSFKIKKIRHQMEVLKWIKEHYDLKQPLWYQLAEWRAHNLLFFFNYNPIKTEHCDLNEDVTLKEKIQFVLLSLLYFNF